jgi:hypothetical protein
MDRCHTMTTRSSQITMLILLSRMSFGRQKPSRKYGRMREDATA